MWSWTRVAMVFLVAFIVGAYVGESKRLVVNVQDCVKYRGLDEGLWR